MEKEACFVPIKKSRESQRNSSVELLRIIAITFVLILHTRFDGILSVYDGALTISHIVRFAFESFAIVGVNVFIMISGYFGIRLTGRSIARYCFQVYYFAAIAILLLWLTGDTPICKSHILRLLFPVSHNVWFVPCYFILTLLAPMLNSYIEKTPLRKLAVYTMLIYVIGYVWGNVFQTLDGFGGYSWGFFIVLYLSGAIIAKWNKNHITSKIAALSGYIFFSILIVVIAVLQIRYDYGRSLLWSYDSPLVMASSICLFLFFSNLKMKHNKVINFIAGSTLAILLLHMSPGSHYFDLHRQIFNSVSGISVIGYSAVVVIGYFIAAVLLDQPRKHIFNFLAKRSNQGKNKSQK